MQGYVGRSIRVYLIDDHDIVRRGLRDLLAVKRDITVVGDSASGHSAVPRIVELEPDVVVLDLHLQDGSGVHVARAIRDQAPGVRVLILTSAGDDEALAATVLAGAAGYATKLVESLEIMEAIRSIGAGRSLLDPTTLEGVRVRLQRRGGGLGLDDDQQAVLELVLAGRGDGEIAARLSLPVEATAVLSTRIIDSLLATSHG